jgi:hypothetical protein
MLQLLLLHVEPWQAAFSARQLPVKAAAMRRQSAVKAQPYAALPLQSAAKAQPYAALHLQSAVRFSVLIRWPSPSLPH